MSASGPLHPTPADFEDALRFLRLSHGQVREFCAAIEGWARAVRDGRPPEVLGSIGRALRGFAEGPLAAHEGDEEQVLFPALDHESLTRIIHDLRRDHGRLRAAWATLAPLWSMPAGIAQDDGAAARAEEAAALLRAHLQREEELLLGPAQHILSRERSHQLGRAMAARRGLVI